MATGVYEGPSEREWRKREHVMRKRLADGAINRVFQRINNRLLWASFLQWRTAAASIPRRLSPEEQERADEERVQLALHPPCSICHGMRCPGFKSLPENLRMCAYCGHAKREHRPVSEGEREFVRSSPPSGSIAPGP